MVMDIQDSKNLPSDEASLKQIIAMLVTDNESLVKDLIAQNNSLAQENTLLSNKVKSLNDEIESLKEKLALLQAKRFGKSSEKLEKQIADLSLRIEEKEVEAAQEKATEAGDIKAKRRPRRMKLPDHLERIDNIIPAPLICQSCGNNDFRKIADETSETLEYIPSSFKVLRNIRPRCACNNCDHIMQAYAPSNTIDKGKAGSGMLAYILIQKYCNHLPFYRQSQIYDREGVEIPRSTLTSWAGQCAKLLKPLIQELQRTVFASTHIHSDDTPVKVLAPGNGKTKTGRLWVYLRDGRSYGDNKPPAICYFYSPDRKGERPANHLKDFTGTMHADAYSGYDRIYASEDKKVTEAACWAHTRRKFYDVTIISDNATIASSALEEIVKLYQIEEEIRGCKPEERLRYRQEKSKKLVENLFANLEKAYNKLPKKGATASAITYALKNKEALMRFLKDGKVEIDNNPAERSLRPIAIGRKNWLFAGSDKGGETAASLYSLIETAKANDVNPWKYLHYVLKHIQDYNSQKIADLLPWNVNLDST